MTIDAPDWGAIRREALRGAARFWPLLLLFAIGRMALGVMVDRLAGGPDLLETGVAGYLAYLRVSLASLVPYSVATVLPLAVVLNGMSGQPVPAAVITRRTMRALPTVIVTGAVFMLPYMATGLILDNNIDSQTWWLARVGGFTACAAMSTVLGFADMEAVARGLGPLAAMRASAALTVGHRTGLAWLFLSLEVFYDVVRQAAWPLEDWLAKSGVTGWGVAPISETVINLAWVAIVPLVTAVYLELRRLQEGEASGLAAFD